VADLGRSYQSKRSPSHIVSESARLRKMVQEREDEIGRLREALSVACELAWLFDEEALLEAAAEGLVDDVGDALRKVRSKLDLPRWRAGKLAGLPVNDSSGRRECDVWKNWENRGTAIGGQSARSLCQLANAIRGARDDRGEVDWDQVASRMAVDLSD